MITRPDKIKDLLFAWLPKDMLNLLFQMLKLEDALSLQKLGSDRLNSVLQEIWKVRAQRHFPHDTTNPAPHDINWLDFFKSKTETNYSQMHQESRQFFYDAKEDLDDNLLRNITSYQQLQSADIHHDTLIKIARRSNKQILLDYYYQIIAAHYLDKHGDEFASKYINAFTLLHWAIFCRQDQQTLATLLAAGANISGSTIGHESTLKLAAQIGNVVALQLLLENGAYRYSEDTATVITKAIAAAIESYHPECIPALIQYAAAHHIRWDQGACLNKTAEMGFIDIFELLLENGVNINARERRGAAAIHTAIYFHQYDVIAWLIEHQADMHLPSNAPRHKGMTPIFYAVCAGDVALTNIFLDMGISVNACDREGYSLLHHAVKCGHLEMVTLLISRGAAIDRNIGGKTTPLHLAATMTNYNICQELIKNGADVTAQDTNGKTPLMIAREKNDARLRDLILRQYPALDTNIRSQQASPNDELQHMFENSSAAVAPSQARPTTRLRFFRRASNKVDSNSQFEANPTTRSHLR